MSAPENSQTLSVEIPRSEDSTSISFAQIKQFCRQIPNRARVECWMDDIPAIESHGNHFTNDVLETHEETIAHSAEKDHFKLDCLQSQNSKLDLLAFVDGELDSGSEGLSVTSNMALGQASYSKASGSTRGPGPGASTVSGSLNEINLLGLKKRRLSQGSIRNLSNPINLSQDMTCSQRRVLSWMSTIFL